MDKKKQRLSGRGLSAVLSLSLAAGLLPSSLGGVVEVSAADSATGLTAAHRTAYYTFDDTLKNEVSGKEAVKQFGGTSDNWGTKATYTEDKYQSGKNGKAFEFQGDSGANRGDGLKLDVSTTEAFTISFWAQPQKRVNYQSLFLVNGDDLSAFINCGSYFNDYSSGAVVLTSGWDETQIWLDKNGGYTPDTVDMGNNTWTYVTFTQDADGNLALYYDGQLLDKDQLKADRKSIFKNLPIYLGVNRWDPSFKGLMDEVAVYDTALTAEEVTTLYVNNGNPQKAEADAAAGQLAKAPAHVTVHDPSIVKDTKTGMYYIFGSHMAWAKSRDLIQWEPFENNINRDFAKLFKTEGEWAAIGDSGYKLSGNLWAPDVIWNETMKKWCMYMTINGGSWNSSICLLTADSPDGDWTYVGTVIYSGFTEAEYKHDFAKTDYTEVTGDTTLPDRYKEKTTWNVNYGAHAIDPCVIEDNGKLYLTYGSWSGGIYMIELDESTGLRDKTVKYELKDNVSDPYMGRKLAGGGFATGEASYIRKIGDYYYLYVTLGGLEATGGYNMRIFRSKDLAGPYVDLSGDDARSQTGNCNSSVGNRVMSGYQWSFAEKGYVSQGHNSVLVDEDGRNYLVYHTRFNDGTETHQVRVHQQFVNEDGWLVTAPFEYMGEKLTTDVRTSDVSGTYEVIFHKLNVNYKNLEVMKGSTYLFDEDGTVQGEQNGTWSFCKDKGAPYVDVTLGDTEYKGVFVEQRKEGSLEKTWCFTLLGNDEISVWGYKNSQSAEELAQAAADALTVPAYVTSDSVSLPTEGLYNSTISWKTSNAGVIDTAGAVKSRGNQNQAVTLTATVSRSGVTKTKTFTVTVCAKGVLYYEDFTASVGTAGDKTGWISPNDSSSVSVSRDSEHGGYLNFAVNTGSNSRGIYHDFGLMEAQTRGIAYTVEADVKLISSNNQASQFAITGADAKYVSDNYNNGITSGYILKLYADPNTTSYKVNDTETLTVSIPSGTWTHIRAAVTVGGDVYAKIGDTSVQTKVNGSGVLRGIYYLRGRYRAGMSIDNIVAKIGTDDGSDTASAPAAVSVKAAENVSKGVKVTWAKVSGVSGYYILRREGSGAWKNIKTISSASTTSYIDKGASNGKSYSYTVQAFKGNVKGKYNTTGKKITYLEAVKLSKLTPKSGKKLEAVYSKNAKGTGYQVQYSTNKNFKSAKTVTVKSAKTSKAVLKKLKKNKKYYVRVRVYKGSNHSAWSNVKNKKATK